MRGQKAVGTALHWLFLPGRTLDHPRAPGHALTVGPRTSRTPAKHASEPIMKVRNSLKSLRGRHRNNRLVRRKGRVYIINKTNRRFKARQG